jgi:hypothetical protein
VLRLLFLFLTLELFNFLTLPLLFSGPKSMLNKKLSAKLLWIQFEDVLAPRLGLTVKERAVYSYLLRHSLVVGKLRLQFAVMSLARTLGLSIGAARHAVRRLDELGTLRVLKRSKTGHLAEMRLPEKIRAVRPGKNGASIVVGATGAMGAVGMGAMGDAGEPPALTLETTDFLKTWALRTLYRLGRLTPAELDARLRALKDLAAGKLRPLLS